MSIFSSFDISASGLFAQRTRLDVIAGNIANAETTRTAEGGPYARRQVVFAEALGRTTRAAGAGVEIVGIAVDPAPPNTVHDPGHPDAGPDGYVALPNVNVIEEMTDMVAATRSYEANVAAMNAAKSMFQSALELGKG